MAGRAATLGTIGCLVALCIWQVFAYGRAEIYHPDSSTYYVLARNIAAGDGYIFDSRPHTRYPPGLPVVLAAAAAVIGSSYDALVRLMPIFGLAGLIGSFFLLRREEGWPVAALACLWLASSPDYFRMATRYIWSDLPYFALSVLALIFARRLSEVSSRSRFVAMATGLCAAVCAAVMVRSAGAALIGALVATLVFNWGALAARTRLGMLAAAASGGVVQAIWMLWTRPHSAPSYPGEYMHTYVAQVLIKDPHQPELGQAGVGDLVSRVAHFAVTQLTRFTQLLLPVPWVDVLWFSPFVIMPALLLLVGIAVSRRQGRSQLLAWYAVAYLALFALWPFDEGARFILPVFPLLFLFVWRGGRACVEWLTVNSARLKHVAIAFAVMALVAAVAYLLLENRGRQGLAAVLFWFVSSGGTFALYAWTRGRATVLPRSVRWVAALAAVPMILGLVAQYRLAAANVTGRQTPASVALAEASAWLRSQPPGTMVMAEQSAIIHRLTGLPLASMPVSSDGRFLAGLLRQKQVRYLVLTPERYEYFKPDQRARMNALLAAEPACCQLVKGSDGYEIYRVGW